MGYETLGGFIWGWLGLAVCGAAWGAAPAIAALDDFAFEKREPVTAHDLRPKVTASLNTLFESLARKAPRGSYPKYFYGEQSYFTVVGADNSDKERRAQPVCSRSMRTASASPRISGMAAASTVSPTAIRPSLWPPMAMTRVSGIRNRISTAAAISGVP
jgi:hypothetical protein